VCGLLEIPVLIFFFESFQDLEEITATADVDVSAEDELREAFVARRNQAELVDRCIRRCGCDRSLGSPIVTALSGLLIPTLVGI
jgi:hypothetical protein